MGTRPKESYNVQLELPARVGFSRGDSDDGRREGLFYSVASTEQALRRLERCVGARGGQGEQGCWGAHRLLGLCRLGGCLHEAGRGRGASWGG